MQQCDELILSIREHVAYSETIECSLDIGNSIKIEHWLDTTSTNSHPFPTQKNHGISNYPKVVNVLWREQEFIPHAARQHINAGSLTPTNQLKFSARYIDTTIRLTITPNITATLMLIFLMVSESLGCSIVLISLFTPLGYESVCIVNRIGVSYFDLDQQNANLQFSMIPI
ncbi:hypothetical protein [Nitrosomonas ureae]|uniref:Uncharacterized protein n=1 Tax=Nitrosomonas ureae TaxID=44577 RepID=A0A1H9E1H1_9PROT|nr:hypothetical protein [Nitrosomonas ureae]SEQ18778.1 hypothetical protein SAMN05421510_102611 [Nitrosomonas ureae]